MSRQLVAVVLSTGEMFGVVMDDSTMPRAQHAATLSDPWACRSANDGSAIASHLAHRTKSDVVLVELVHIGEHVSHAGRGRARRYRARTSCRVLVSAQIGRAAA